MDKDSVHRVPLVAIVDYGAGNVHSVGRMLTSLGVDWVHTWDENELCAATHLLMPGVGHCAQAMRSLNGSGTVEVLNNLVLHEGVPVLGICLGMQLMTLCSAEGATSCLGWFDSETIRIAPANRRVFKVPNIGWHAIEIASAATAFAGVDVDAQPFYFCHAYAVMADGVAGVTATFDYESRYAACLQRDNIIGVQFHPEKSQEAGATLMRNFLKMGPCDV